MIFPLHPLHLFFHGEIFPMILPFKFNPPKSTFLSWVNRLNRLNPLTYHYFAHNSSYWTFITTMNIPILFIDISYPILFPNHIPHDWLYNVTCHMKLLNLTPMLNYHFLLYLPPLNPNNPNGITILVKSHAVTIFHWSKSQRNPNQKKPTV